MNRYLIFGIAVTMVGALVFSMGYIQESQLGDVSENWCASQVHISERFDYWPFGLLIAGFGLLTTAFGMFVSSQSKQDNKTG